MTMIFDNPEFKDKHAKFNREYNRVEPYKSRIPLTKNEKLKVEYRECLVKTYNDIIKYLEPINKTAQLEERFEIQGLIFEHLRKLKECFYTLKLQYEFGKGIFDEIVLENISEVEIESNSIFDNIPTNTNNTLDNDNLTSENSDSTIQKENQILHNSNPALHGSASSLSSSEKTEIMAQTKQDLIATANRLIHFKFNGDPLALDSFIDAVKLLEDVCEVANKPTMLKFLMTRLEGDAREAIETPPEDIDDFIEQLEEHIKPDSAKVIEGRILALRIDKTNLTQFSKRAEELAEQYRRSLCKEGFSKEKSKELAIEKTVDLCRKSAKSPTVKSVIASTKFSEPKEVIAKMIVEINNIKLDKHSTPFNHKYNNNQNKNGNNKFSNSQNRNFRGNSNNYRNSGASTSQNSNNYRQNSQNNNNNQNRGYRNNYNNNYNSRTFTNSNGNNKNDRPVRFYSGNEENPGNGGQDTEQTQQ